MQPNDTNWKSLRLTYGITPPKITTPEDRRRKTAARQTERIRALPVDALVVYDLQDESSRTDVERPFPYLRAIDPLDYAGDYLAGVPQKKIVYRSVSGLDEAGLVDWLGRARDAGDAVVFVGAPSQKQAVDLKLGDAYRIRQAEAADVPLGGVVIAERHETGGGEDARLLRKESHGCSFFVSQAVYSVTASKNLLSDLHYRCESLGRPTPPILITLSPCGSLQTLAFMDWLGVSVPAWLRNELAHAKDILARSIELCVATFEELYDFAREKSIPLGCNVESVSLGKAEIDASVEIVHAIDRRLGGDAKPPG